MRTNEGPPLIIDGSNICRDKAMLPPDRVADWASLHRLIDALDLSTDIHFSNVLVIIDRSLVRDISDVARRELRKMERQGRLEVRQFADERMIELAFDMTSPSRGALIATLDYFDDFRRRYPELQGCRDRVVGWSVAASSVGIRVYFRDLGVHTHHRISRKEEEGEIKARRLRREDVRNRAAANHFRCTNNTCIVSTLWPDRLIELPSYDDRTDTFVCPSCAKELERGTARLPAVQFLVMLEGDERFRMLLEDGEAVDLGRDDRDGCIGLQRHIPTGRASAVSRRHVHISVRAGASKVLVEDLDSKNGTTLRRRLRGGSDETVRLVPGVPVKWLLRDEVVLPGGITVERSGRSLPSEGIRPGDAVQDPSTTDSPTRFTRP